MPVEFGPEPGIAGSLHEPERPNGDAILLAHGAGVDRNSTILVVVADALEGAGYLVLRFDLPFRQERPHGPPRFGSAERDRSGIRQAALALKKKSQGRGRIFLGGHSYGGRQSSMLVAEDPQICDGLLLLSYPLHPPRKPGQLRTAHFPNLTRPVFFVQGTRDPLGPVDELKAALDLIPAAHAVLEIHGAGHDLIRKNGIGEVAHRIAAEFSAFIGT